jgi:WhiB family transcriptional regulator, redox-sensing transcriptional regulator
MDTVWMARGNCASQPPSLFFPSDGVGVEVARRICATCPVKDECLEHALVNRIDHGVWGGVTAAHRGFTPCRWASRRRPSSSGLP